MSDPAPKPNLGEVRSRIDAMPANRNSAAIRKKAARQPSVSAIVPPITCPAIIPVSVPVACSPLLLMVKSWVADMPSSTAPKPNEVGFMTSVAAL